MNVTKRMGTFFLVMGTALLVLFFASDYLEQANGWYLLGGVVSFGVGLALSQQGRESREPVERFRLMRRMFGGGSEKEREKEKARQKESDREMDA